MPQPIQDIGMEIWLMEIIGVPLFAACLAVGNISD
jgi:hypothetical protein